MTVATTPIAIRYSDWGETRTWTCFTSPPDGGAGEQTDIQEADALRLLDVESVEAADLRPNNWYVVGVGRRLLAGLTSLVDRAELDVRLISTEEPRTYVHGDSDQAATVRVGGVTYSGTMTGRKAGLRARIVLHRSVGGRVEWRWDLEHPREGEAPTRGLLDVASSSTVEATQAPVATMLAIAPILMDLLLDRIVAVIAADGLLARWTVVRTEGGAVTGAWPATSRAEAKEIAQLYADPPDGPGPPLLWEERDGVLVAHDGDVTYTLVREV